MRGPRAGGSVSPRGRRLVFNNASGVGQRVGDQVGMTELFARCQAHYGFETTFGNPYSGQEKGYGKYPVMERISPNGRPRTRVGI